MLSELSLHAMDIKMLFLATLRNPASDLTPRVNDTKKALAFDTTSFYSIQTPGNFSQMG